MLVSIPVFKKMAENAKAVRQQRMEQQQIHH
jgi:hypothetical protein